MKLTNTLNTPASLPQLRDVFGPVGATLGRGAKAVGRGLSRALYRMQMARMQSVLHAMSDEQLAQAGTTRSDIPQHAAFLVGYKYDGL
tara:strand:+ start:115434 stop:115697 length:264 start_codon:yes stop_codon:yes gene_type:complete